MDTRGGENCLILDGVCRLRVGVRSVGGDGQGEGLGRRGERLGSAAMARFGFAGWTASMTLEICSNTSISAALDPFALA